tara:strand:+ start:290 stop:427 length:138 start_codon:yes stop_codon:yes gene_type:complete
MDTIEKLEEIEELCDWNLSFGIPIKETLKSLKRLDLVELFSEFFV